MGTLVRSKVGETLVQADGRQAVFAEGHVVVMGLSRLESYPVG